MSASKLPEAMEENLDKIDSALDNLETALEPILATPWDTLNACLEPVQRAKLNLMIAYTIDSLFFLYLKTQQGIATEEHQVNEELARVKSYMSKLKDATAAQENEKSKLKLNKDAAARFIKAGLV
ncbi:hypothetical protein GUITHDRAFT_67864 [Guillardia theta CCMP2712]|uniref:Nuclear nucleic acid-binding protein C1D n=1 Tax=Guillardia theta (strain CCMP2712) TaxID=905079 RepID=L1JMV5_GUITC|nr:hypothetical protein GUITHDRAFT_67864 [Guillardia theta CCMP2712]EKX49403.1 hypothetical protein GUITHDRAFT_67864 [Guillardia theta CCMP2712]|eukprot:XP_005836383.1 hypothetical protein GUITHDRAFT_67864 [Guillardia theta CCMP2712]